MAIIVCPECNGKISNTAKQCVHCGAKITVCPECESVFLTEMNMCPTCGYVFANEQHNNVFDVLKQESLTTAKDCYNHWKKQSALNEWYDNKGVKWMCNALSAVLTVLFVITAYSWVTDITSSNIDVALNAANYQSTLSKLKINIVATIFIYALKVIYGCIGKEYEAWNLGLYCKKNNINTKEIISNSFMVNFGEKNSLDVVQETSPLKKLIRADMYMNNVAIRNRLLSLQFVKTVMVIISEICCSIYAINIAGTLMYKMTQKQLWGTPFDLSIWDFITASLIVFIIVLIVDGTTEQIHEKKDKEFLAEWVKSNIPQHEDKYKKYVEDTTAYLIDRFGEEDKR